MILLFSAFLFLWFSLYYLNYSFVLHSEKYNQLPFSSYWKKSLKQLSLWWLSAKIYLYGSFWETATVFSFFFSMKNVYSSIEMVHKSRIKQISYLFVSIINYMERNNISKALFLLYFIYLLDVETLFSVLLEWSNSLKW